MTNKELQEIAATLVSQRIEQRQPVEMEWAIQSIIGNYTTGNEGDFFLFCAHHTVWQAVKRAIEKYDKAEEEPGQMLLGLATFERLKIAYSIFRDGTIQLLHVACITDEEFRARATGYRAQSEGCLAHAREIERFIEYRKEHPNWADSLSS